MVSKQSTHEHPLEDGLSLNLYALDPGMTKRDLARIVSPGSDNALGFDPKSLENDFSMVASLSSPDGLVGKVLDKKYEVPQWLQPYRVALEASLKEASLKPTKIFNGEIIVIEGNLEVPLTVCNGGYFDFKATELTAIPADLSPDFYPEGKTPDLYLKGKTIGELLHLHNLDASQMVRYLGFGFIMLTNGGDEISLTHRAKGVGIGADYMTVPGGTPPFHKDFFKKGFDFPGYFENVIKKEMYEEYGLSSEEFRIGTYYLIDDKTSVPFVAVEIFTRLSTKKIAQRCYGNEKAMEEHPVLYAASKKSAPIIAQRFRVAPSLAYVLHEIVKAD
ncbi:hypothetical protein CMO93_00880 [Candidatus Woesearchaeota archaeon]|nr:hypothetical protein [Candidatus Woesearchaeota archaeon]|tara:strand:+ start:82 stop:1077 length:996 start_codon:yes stop_codon:yes gene_type:complete